MFQTLLVHHQGVHYCLIKQSLNNILISCIWTGWGVLGTVNTSIHKRAAPRHCVIFLFVAQFHSTRKNFNKFFYIRNILKIVNCCTHNN